MCQSKSPLTYIIVVESYCLFKNADGVLLYYHCHVFIVHLLPSTRDILFYIISSHSQSVTYICLYLQAYGSCIRNNVCQSWRIEPQYAYFLERALLLACRFTVHILKNPASVLLQLRHCIFECQVQDSSFGSGSMLGKQVCCHYMVLSLGWSNTQFISFPGSRVPPHY